MTKTEAAIKELEVMARSAIGAANDSTMPEVGKEAARAGYVALDTALTALREALEREWGCYCCKNIETHNIRRAVVDFIDKNGEYVEKLNMPYEYCVNCGRKLATDNNVGGKKATCKDCLQVGEEDQNEHD